MSITKSQILAHLNSELNRTETDIDEHILAAMKDLSLQDEFVWVESTMNTIKSKPYYSLPSDYKKLLSIKCGDDNSLTLIDWGKYQARIANETSNDWSKPNKYCIHGGFWYAYPTPDDVYTITMFYNAFIPESEDGVNAVDNISHYFSDIYRDAIYAKTIAQYCMSKGLKEDAATYQAIYMNILLPMLRDLVQKQVREVQYTDL